MVINHEISWCIQNARLVFGNPKDLRVHQKSSVNSSSEISSALPRTSMVVADMCEGFRRVSGFVFDRLWLGNLVTRIQYRYLGFTA